MFCCRGLKHLDWNNPNIHSVKQDESCVSLCHYLHGYHTCFHQTHTLTCWLKPPWQAGGSASNLKAGIQGCSQPFPVMSLPWTHWYSCSCPAWWWHYKASAKIGWSGVSILVLDEVASLICNFVLADLSLRHMLHVAGMLSNQNQTTWRW